MSIITLKKKSKCILITCLVTLLTVPLQAGAVENANFNFGWKFAKGEQPGSRAPTFDDSSWERIDLPHDWAIAGPFGDAKEEGHTGKLPWKGEGVYRKHFSLPAEAQGKRLQLIFDGVMASPKVYLNGTEVGSWIYGYNSFWIDATDAARFGEDNVLVVHADTREHGSRWYPGAGIYRKVTMRLVAPVHIPVWGVVVTTPEVKAEHASVELQVEVVNKTSRKQTVSVETTITDPEGMPVARAVQEHVVAAGGLDSVPLGLSLQKPLRWDVDTPQLYTATTLLRIKGTEIHREETTFGVRQFQWTANDGFHLNGRRVQLNGVNLHHDQGPLGAAFFPRSMERQLLMMKKMGVNAIRTSHNPSAPELLELCDRMGFVVWNELFDKYGTTAGVSCGIDEFVEQYAEREVENFMRRDRNHPCIIIWSIGNEIGNLKEKHVDQMVNYFKEWDTSRPVGLGSHVPGQAHRVVNSLDASGWNYAQKYMTARKAQPDMPLIYSESASAFGTRGAYRLSTPGSKTDWGDDGRINAHVLTSATWSDIPEHEFERMIKHPFVAGEFVWTGYDYLGEPTPFKRARSSYFGIVDLAGLPKDGFYLYRSHWLPESTTLHLAPHWNWEGQEGKNVPVIVYTNGEEAELFLNGKSLGRKRKARPEEVVSDNLAFGKTTSASSEELKQDTLGNVQTENLSGKAVDGNADTRWCADSDAYPQHWQVDLEKSGPISKVVIQWEKESGGYDFELLISLDGQQWSRVDATVHSHNHLSELEFDSRKARWVRVEIKSGTGWASLREVTVLEKAVAVVDPYYQIVDAYRLRWSDVPYEAGTLTAVAYKNGERIGEVSNRTAGPAARLQLSPERTELQADGMDLCYINIDMLDKDGNLCPHAMDRMSFSVEGAATLAGVANGDPMGHDPFTDESHPLFFGKAVAILRSMPGNSGPAVLKVTTERGIEAETTLIFKD